MFGLGLPELIVILLILVLLFGAKQLPKMARSLGESSRELKKGFREVQDAGRDDKNVKKG